MAHDGWQKTLKRIRLQIHFNNHHVVKRTRDWEKEEEERGYGGEGGKKQEKKEVTTREIEKRGDQKVLGMPEGEKKKSESIGVSDRMGGQGQ